MQGKSTEDIGNTFGYLSRSQQSERRHEESKLSALAALFAASAWAQAQPAPKYAAKVPPSIQTPDTVQTRIGTLKFFDGPPDADTVRKVYDNLDFNRGAEAFLSGMPAAAVYGFCEGLSEAGVKRNQGIGIMEDLMDARSLFLTANSTTVYVLMCMDLSKGPVVLQVPPNVLGPVDDAYFRYVTDLGLVGRDKGQGGKYLFVPPGYKDELPKDGYFVSKSRTNGNLVFYRAFVKGGDIAAAVKGVKAAARIYPLSAAANPPKQGFVNLSGVQFNTIHANDFHFYEELNHSRAVGAGERVRSRAGRIVCRDRDQEGQALPAQTPAGVSPYLLIGAAP